MKLIIIYQISNSSYIFLDPSDRKAIELSI